MITVVSSRSQRFVSGLVVVMMLVTCGCVARKSKEPVTVYYLHSTTRCADCLEIERISREALQQAFPEELDRGHLVWRPVNSDLPENTHYVFDFELSANELVVVKGDADRQREWNKLPDAWRLVREPELLHEKLVRMVTRALASAD